MKSIGELAKEFRKARGWSYTRMAQEVAKHGDGAVSRQAITQLESVGGRKPHYISALARVMGTTTDKLLSGVETQATQEFPALTSPATLIAPLAAALRTFDAPARERAAVLLQGLARDPDGPWAAWLGELLANPAPEPRQAPAEPFKYTKINQPIAPLRRKQQ